MTEAWRAAIGRTRIRRDVIAPWQARAMKGLLGQDPDGVGEGDPLPLGWHWLYFHDALPRERIGPDGHELRGEFLPRIDLPRRMWAGGTLRSRGPVVIGRPAELESRVAAVLEKEGRTGPLVFVTVEHTLTQDGVAVEEEQTLVYRERSPRAEGSGPAADRSSGTSGDAPESAPLWSETFVPTTVTLFQFSALTYNAHRIHYDQAYARDEEGYAGVLVHGPLTALMLLDAASRHGSPVTSYRYRALAPLFAGEEITLVGRPPGEADDGGGREPIAEVEDVPGVVRVVEALRPSGLVAMRGSAV